MTSLGRRWLAFLGGCLAGLGLGGITSIFNQAIEAIELHVDSGFQDVSQPNLWIASIAVGIGLGGALAAMIPNDPAPVHAQETVTDSNTLA
jgi:hypothetical protein